jgi:hypothetical protein
MKIKTDKQTIFEAIIIIIHLAVSDEITCTEGRESATSKPSKREDTRDSLEFAVSLCHTYTVLKPMDRARGESTNMMVWRMAWDIAAALLIHCLGEFMYNLWDCAIQMRPLI